MIMNISDVLVSNVFANRGRSFVFDFVVIHQEVASVWLISVVIDIVFVVKRCGCAA